MQFFLLLCCFCEVVFEIAWSRVLNWMQFRSNQSIFCPFWNDERIVSNRETPKMCWFEKKCIESRKISEINASLVLWRQLLHHRAGCLGPRIRSLGDWVMDSISQRLRGGYYRAHWLKEEKARGSLVGASPRDWRLNRVKDKSMNMFSSRVQSTGVQADDDYVLSFLTRATIFTRAQIDPPHWEKA